MRILEIKFERDWNFENDLRIRDCQKFEANPNYGNHPGGEGGKYGDGLFFTNLNYAKIRDNYMQIYNKQTKHNCI